MKTLLAKLCANRFVTCSPDGVCHLTWRQVTLHIIGVDLAQVVKFLELVTDQVTPGLTYSDASCSVRQAQHDRVELWLFGVGLILAPGEIAELLRLGKTAVGHYRTIENDPIRLLMDAELPTYPAMVLSLN